MRNRIATNPIIDWTTREVWQYIKDNKIKINPLYSQGYSRVGCICCTMSGKNMLIDAYRYPKYKAAYIRAFDKMIEVRKQRGLRVDGRWKDGASVFKWWTNRDYNPDQLQLEEFGNE